MLQGMEGGSYKERKGVVTKKEGDSYKDRKGIVTRKEWDSYKERKGAVTRKGRKGSPSNVNKHELVNGESSSNARDARCLFIICVIVYNLYYCC